MSREPLAETADLLLEVGKTSFENGADTCRTVQTVLAFGELLGCSSVRAAPHYSSMSVTVGKDEDSITRIAFMRPTGVNLSAVLHLRHFLAENRGKVLDEDALRKELEEVRTAARPRGLFQLCLLVAVSCAAFCKLFGGDLPAMATTSVAAFTGFMLRGAMLKRGFNAYFMTFAVSLVASLVAGVACVTGWSQTPEQAIVASVLYLVPGVPLINAIEDIARGYPVIGSGRLTHALALFVSIAVGLAISVRLTGVALT